MDSDQCRFRKVCGHKATCTLLGRLAFPDLLDTSVCERTCQTCLQYGPQVNGRINPVIASLLFDRINTTVSPDELRTHNRQQLAAYARRQLLNSSTQTQPTVPSVHTPAPMRSRLNSCWQSLRTRRRRPRIGLVGWASRTGLGYQNHDIMQNLPAERWLVPVDAGHSPELARQCRSATIVSAHTNPSALRQWLDGLDWLIFVETEYIRGLAATACAMGVQVACIPNHESLCIAQCEWMHEVDLMLCPTQFTFRTVGEICHQFQFSWRSKYIPWPISLRRFPFRVRKTCQRFLFVNGTGGIRGRSTDGTYSDYRRKGLDVLLSAVRLVPDVPITVYSQRPIQQSVPSNVTICPGPRNNRTIYEDGDVCVLPSHWEGLGLQMLECQAAGLPLVTTDAPPMNEHNPVAVVPVTGTQTLFAAGHRPTTASLLDPQDLADVLSNLHKREIDDASRAARSFISRHHTWSQARPLMIDALMAPMPGKK